MTSLMKPPIATARPRRTAHLRTTASAAAAMFMVGTLAAVSGVIGTYPVYGGQALRYALAAVILLAVARARGLGPVRLARRAGPVPAITPPVARDRTAREPVRLAPGGWALLGLLSLTGLVIFNVCVIEAARASSPSLVGTIVGTVPLALAVLGPLTRPADARSLPSPRLIGAAIVVVAGATLATGLGSGNLPGLMWSLGALACEVCFSLLALPLLPTLGAIRVSAYSAALAVPFLLVMGAIVDGGAMLRMPTTAEALGLGYLAVIVTTVAFFLWYTALPRLGADRAGLFAGMIPVGAIVTTLVLGLGTPSAADLAGAAVVIAGLALGLRTGSS
ncbi:DMT family transporter [Planotetraspora sp. GP83]|uniref:DMT family transporter n=1 Tax=Planotetraspora sp. GP83 TaxID=3156264 RepID=UPI003514A034